MTARPVARTRDEALLYLDLHPCPRCGSAETTWANALVELDDDVAERYTGVCEECGGERGYLFGAPKRELISTESPVFGGSEASQLLDAGEWLGVADLTAGHVPVGEPEAARRALSIAAAAVGEVVKFIPPGEDRVPDSAFWSAASQQTRDAGPDRFHIDWLLRARDTYRRLAAEQR